jgi:hypothetical protein
MIISKEFWRLFAGAGIPFEARRLCARPAVTLTPLA